MKSAGGSPQAIRPQTSYSSEPRSGEQSIVPAHG